MYPSDNAYFNLLHAGVRDRELREQRYRPEKEREPMPPDHSYIVERCANDHRHLLQLNTEESIREFMLILGARMVAEDANWGFLSKLPAEKHLVLPDGHTLIGVDAFCWKPELQVIDVLTNAVEDRGTAGPSWLLRPRRPSSTWVAIAPQSNGGTGGTTSVVEELRRRLEVLERTAIKDGDQISLMTQPWGDTPARVVCADQDRQDTPLLANRDDVGSWERFTVGKP